MFPTPGEQQDPLFFLRPVETQQTTASLLPSLQVRGGLVAFQLQGVPSHTAPERGRLITVKSPTIRALQGTSRCSPVRIFVFSFSGGLAVHYHREQHCSSWRALFLHMKISFHRVITAPFIARVLQQERCRYQRRIPVIATVQPLVDMKYLYKLHATSHSTARSALVWPEKFANGIF